ncbi:RDD family protein [Piscinibacter sp. HJYY11]|uniref:RDD family protein n=1 Tax=Piscinibacter sp. HJYY11 TaxID=2801333 RepID=UPI00191D0AFC|nr:RDD family protein [Piscinibacter sp. HJYY11]MBL0726827.1 RDD family protein [Piscinibacter sp. HJYY11]
MTSREAAQGGELQAPSLRRRLACLLYEALLLFGVTLVSGFVGTLVLKITGAATATSYHVIMQIVGVAVWGLYFVWFWTRRGQTLPMQTWRIKVVTATGAPLTVTRAALRFAACALWIAPAYLLAKLNHWSATTELTAVGIGIVVYALLSRLHPQRQFWHDALCGTRLVTTPDPRRPATT